MSRGFGHRSENPGGSRKVRCVLWTPRGGTPPRELETELNRKGIEFRAADNAHGAMGLMVGWASERKADSRAVRVLIMIEPERLSGARELLDSMEQYVSDMATWVYSPGANPTLRALVEGDMPAAASNQRVEQRSPAPSNGEARPAAIPRVERRPMPLRLAEGIDAGPAQASGGVREDGEPPKGSQLTDEELAMLLGDEPPHGEGKGRDPRRGR